MKLETFGSMLSGKMMIKGRRSVTPGLAVTRAYVNNKPTHTGYRVTHLPSLLHAAEGLTYREAHAVAALLAHVTDWTRSAEDIQADTTIGTAIRRVRAFVKPLRHAA